LALKLRVNLEAKNKAPAVTWEKFKEEKSPLKEVTPVPTETIESPETPQLSLQEKESEQLATELQMTLNKRSKLSTQDFDQNIAMADELISRDPNVYSSYKAKLILLLSKEGALKEAIDDSEIEELLTTMSNFNMLSERTLQKEAFLIARTNEKIDVTNDEIVALQNEIEQSSDQADTAQLEAQLQSKFDEVTGLEAQIEEGLLDRSDFLNEDILEIPLYRSLASKDYEAVIDDSREIMTQFPHSLSAHFFLIRALELAGESEVAQDHFKNLALKEEDLRLLTDRLNSTRNKDPKDYWKDLRF